MTQYKVHIDKPLPDSKRIKGHQDFDTLYDQYQVNTRFQFWRQLYQNPRYFAGLAAVLAVIFLVYQAVEEDRIMELAFVNPPIEQIDYQSLTFPAGEPILIETEGIRNLHIPALAFVDATGLLVSDSVEIRFRELYAPMDFALLGVPMQYDSTQQLVAATGVDVQAFRHGERVFLKEGIQIEAEMLVMNQEAELQLYYLDSTAKQWSVRQGLTQKPMTAASVPRPEKPILLAQIEREDLNGTTKASATPFKPGKPFGVKLKNAADYPRFANYQWTYWEYLEGPGSDNPWTAGLITEIGSEVGEQAWEDVRVERLGGSAERYRLRFARQTTDAKIESRVVVARPLFEARNQAQANAYYQTQLDKYDQDIAVWQSERQALLERKSLKERLQAAYAQDLRQWQQDNTAPEVEARDSIVVAKPFLLYHFKIDRLGTYQIAKLVARPEFSRAILLTDSLGNLLNGELLAAGKQPVLLSFDKITLYRGQYRNDTLFFPPLENAQILLSTEAGEMAFVNPNSWLEAKEEKVVSLKSEMPSEVIEGLPEE